MMTEAWPHQVKGAGGQREAVVQDHIGAGGQDDSDDTGLDSLQERLHIGIVWSSVFTAVITSRMIRNAGSTTARGGQGMRLQVRLSLLR